MGAAEQLRQIAHNFERVSERIAVAAAGRAVRLVCVTKYAKPPWIEDLLTAGATDLAENRLPEALDRFALLKSAGIDFTSHLIGPQQSRKLRLVPGNFDWFQALDSLKTAAALDTLLAASGQRLQVLLQVNIAEEPQKRGVSPQTAADDFGQVLAQCSQLALRGIMAIPPWAQSYTGAAEFERGTRGHFRQMKCLFDKIASQFRDRAMVDTLSLGMSQDYVWAIEEGATMVRVGSALFEGLEG